MLFSIDTYNPHHVYYKLTSRAHSLKACVLEMHFCRCKKKLVHNYNVISQQKLVFMTSIENRHSRIQEARRGLIKQRCVRCACIAVTHQIQYRVYSPNIALDDFSSSSEAASTTAEINMCQKTLRSDKTVMSFMRGFWARWWSSPVLLARARNITNQAFLESHGVA